MENREIRNRNQNRNPESGIPNWNRNRNRNRNRETETGNGTGPGTGTGNGTGNGTRFGEINECFKLGSMIHIKTPPPFSSLPRKMDDDTRNSFKVAEHSFQEPMPNSP